MTQAMGGRDENSAHHQQALDAQRLGLILEKYKQDGNSLMAILEEVQAEYGYLPEHALRTVANETGRSLVDIYGVATFYRSFSLKPRGRHLICACQGTACHVRGAARVVEELQRQLGVASGETTPDNEFTLEMVNCLGACALGPIVVVDGTYYSNVTTSKVKRILEEAAASGQVAEDALPVEASDR